MYVCMYVCMYVMYVYVMYTCTLKTSTLCLCVCHCPHCGAPHIVPHMSCHGVVSGHVNPTVVQTHLT